jgi:hypothetical protein
MAINCGISVDVSLKQELDMLKKLENSISVYIMCKPVKRA